ncbi:carbon-nitrogen hydrolase family protein [uncultured Nitratireductor sp.]|uniref:carbon-nitrogen hydrolase family protein n=1 Tax=uncultured Nitratireductor sp. TaxID=520953 RepID=UPI0025F5BAC0|nr:carbon-nitrogen hydrolase family protein [uncultured Nitratireductor sp.]
MKVTLLQMNVRDDKRANLEKAAAMIRRTVEKERPRLIALPECFDIQGGPPGTARAAAEPFPQSAAYRLMQELARELGVYIHAGSVAELHEGQVYNTTVVFDDAGREIARYRKIHLFDVATPDGMIYRESDSYGRGTEIVTYQVDGITFGCTICYDLRFPELFAALARKGADVIVLPAAFTLMTGKDHWEVLLRARAIETQTYVLAPGQIGEYIENGERRRKYGHSMVAGPWGTVVARAEDMECGVTAHLEIDHLHTVRREMPVREHHVLGTPVSTG